MDEADKLGFDDLELDDAEDLAWFEDLCDEVRLPLFCKFEELVEALDSFKLRFKQKKIPSSEFSGYKRYFMPRLKEFDECVVKAIMMLDDENSNAVNVLAYMRKNTACWLGFFKKNENY